MRKITMAAGLLALVFSFSLTGCSQGAEPAMQVEEEVEDINAYADFEERAAATVSENVTEAAAGRTDYGKERERKDGMVRSYLTGKWVDEEVGDHRPVAVMLNNIKEAQPMSGVGSADVIYESVVEGSLTRMMGIFEDYRNLDKIGSVRSCRNYFVYYALEFDAIYAHYGQSAYAVSLLEKDYVDNLSGLSSIGGIVFYRTSDRVAPHNAYASAKGIDEGIRKLGYRTAYRDDYKGKFTFAHDDETVTLSGDDGYDATRIAPGYLINKPWFEYDPSTKKYYRFQYDDKQIDDLTGEQLSVDNIVLQYSSWEQVDDKGYLGFDCHSGGKMTYITNGRAVDGAWIRYDGDQGAVRYYDAEGNEIIFNQGKTWICIIQDTYGDNVEIK